MSGQLDAATEGWVLTIPILSTSVAGNAFQGTSVFPFSIRAGGRYRRQCLWKHYGLAGAFILIFVLGLLLIFCVTARGKIIESSAKSV